MSMWSARTRALAGAAVASGTVAAGVLVSPSTIVGTVDAVAADPFLFGLLVAGLYLVRPFLAWPTTPLAVVVGYGFGVAVGVPVALVGVVVTVLPVFVAARWLAADDPATTRDTRSRATETPGEDTDSGLLEQAGETVARYYETAGRSVASSPRDWHRFPRTSRRVPPRSAALRLASW